MNIHAIDFNVLLGLMIFVIGVVGFIIRKNGLVALMCLELILNGINIVLVSFAKIHGDASGSALYLFIVLVAAAEAAIGLSLFVSLYRLKGTINLDEQTELRG